VLDRHLNNLFELARFIIAHVTSVVLGDRRVLSNAPFMDRIKLEDIRFDPEQMRVDYAAAGTSASTYRWSFDPFVLDRFRSQTSVKPPAPVSCLPQVEVGRV
jgi:hypothetical protein